MATVSDQYQSHLNKYMTGFQMAFIDIEHIKEQMSQIASLADTSYVVSDYYLVTFLFVSVQNCNLKSLF